MKPVILDDSKALNELTTDFSNGLGRLSECTEPRVIEEANGIYEAEFDIPVTAKHFADLHVDGILKIKANEYDELQLFRIYQITKPLNGICHVSLQHISYDMTKVAVRPFNTVGAVATMQSIQNNMVGTYPFIFYTDIDNLLSSYSVVAPCSARSCIGGRQGSFIDVFGGEIHWNNLQVNVMAHRGSDRNVRISYGKNLVDYRQEVNNSNVYTAVLGYATRDDSVYTGDIQYVVQSSHPKTLIVDFTSEFDSDEEITVAKINTKATSYIQSHDIGTPAVNIDVDFVHLWQTEEYKEIASLERVALFDTVHVFIPKLGVEATAKVVKTVYDPVEERYTKIELGNVRANLGSVITEAVDNEIANSASSMYGRISSQIQAQIERATAFLTGAEGGFQVTHYHADGTPYETLWMNTDSEATATNILRINANGLGFSNDGGATYRNAWLIDGTLSADFIGTGTITAISIVGSTLTFGDSPNTVTLRTNNAKTGALFEGEGVMQFETNGEFLAKNLDSNNYVSNQIRMRSDVSDSSRTYNRISFLNTKNNVMANQFYADAANDKNEFWFYNNRVGVTANANNHYMGATSSAYANRLYNYKFNSLSSGGGTITANNLRLESYANYNWCSFDNRNESGDEAGYLSFRSQWTSGDTYNGLWLNNYNLNSTLANGVFMSSNSSVNWFQITNNRSVSSASESPVHANNIILNEDSDDYDLNLNNFNFGVKSSSGGALAANKVLLSSTSGNNEIYIRNLNVGGTYYQNQFSLTHNKSTLRNDSWITNYNNSGSSMNSIGMCHIPANDNNQIDLNNYHINGNMANSIFMSSTNNASYLSITNKKTDGTVRTGIYMNSDGNFEITTNTGGNHRITMNKNGNLDVVGNNVVYLGQERGNGYLSLATQNYRGDVYWTQVSNIQNSHYVLVADGVVYEGKS